MQERPNLKPKDTDQERKVLAIVYAELVLYIKGTRKNEKSAPVHKLADLVQLYQSKMEQLVVRTDTRVHSIRFKHRLLAQFPDTQTPTKEDMS